MKTEYKFIRFYPKQIEHPDVWVCLNSKYAYKLGTVSYYKPWRCWCYRPCADTEYSAECLTDIAHFCRQLNEKYPSGKVG